MKTMGVLMLFLTLINGSMIIGNMVEDLFKFKHYVVANSLMIVLFISCYMIAGGN